MRTYCTTSPPRARIRSFPYPCALSERPRRGTIFGRPEGSQASRQPLHGDPDDEGEMVVTEDAADPPAPAARELQTARDESRWPILGNSSDLRVEGRAARVEQLGGDVELTWVRPGPSERRLE